MSNGHPQIDPEFAALLYPLEGRDRELLEESILREGCRDPLTVWDGILLDGHNRLKICKKHGIGYRVTTIELPDRIAAMDWIDANQLGRRNVSPEQAQVIRGRLYNRRKKQATGFDDRKSSKTSVDQIDPRETTAQQVARETGVSEATVKRDGQFVEAVDKLREALPDLQGQEFPKSRVIEAAKHLDDLDEARAILTGKAKREQVPTDALGQPIEGTIADDFARKGEMQSLVSQINKILATLRDGAKKRDPLFIALNMQAIEVDLRGVRHRLKSAMPYAICPYCAGDGCKACLKRGWVGKFVYDHAPREMKA